MTGKELFRMEVGFGTDTGKVRSRNEDAVFADGKRGLFIVADGMGGHLAGEVASRVAVETIRALLPAASQGDGNESARHKLTEVVGNSHEEILRRSSTLNELEGMGSTVVIAWVLDEWVHVANVGDSRAYLYRGRSLRQVTDDHSLAARMVRQGELAAKDARHHALHSVLYSALGHDSQPPEADVHSYEHRDGDVLLLCSDGLSDMIEDHEIEKVLQASRSAQGACDQLIQLANQNGGRDNITSIVVRFGGT